MRRTLFLIASVLVSALFLYLALRGIPLNEIATSLQQANPAWIVVALVMGSLGLWTRGIRWRGLLQNRINPVEAFYMLCVAMLLNQLPMRAGEVARSALVTRSGVPFFTAATSIVVERLLDTLFVVIVLSLSLTQIPDAPPTITQAATLFGIAGIVALGSLLVFARRPQLARDLLAFVERLLPFIKKLPLHSLMEHILDGIKPLAHWRTAAHAIFWTIISWTFSLLTFYPTALALGVTDGAVIMTLLSVTMASFAIAIPVSVASIGPFEGAVIVSGQAVGIARALAGALGFLFHGITVLTYAIWGTVGLLALGVSLSDVLKSDKSNDKPDIEPIMAGESLSVNSGQIK